MRCSCWTFDPLAGVANRLTVPAWRSAAREESISSLVLEQAGSYGRSRRPTLPLPRLAVCEDRGMPRIHTVQAAVAAVLMAGSWVAQAQPQQDALYRLVVASARCEQDAANGRLCRYQIGKTLDVSIKDAGGTDTVVAFNFSSVKEEIYAVWYFGCVAVVPGEASTGRYRDAHGVYISPRNGLVFQSRAECERSQ